MSDGFKKNWLRICGTLKQSSIKRWCRAKMFSTVRCRSLFPPSLICQPEQRQVGISGRHLSGAFESCYKVMGDLKTSLTDVLTLEVPHAQNNFRPHKCLYSHEMGEWSGRSNILPAINLLHLHAHSIGRWCRCVMFMVHDGLFLPVLFLAFPPSVFHSF